MNKNWFLLVWLPTLAVACQKESDATSSNAHKAIFTIQFDPSQTRLDNVGSPSSIPNGHAAQTPSFHQMSVHYIELAPNAFTALGAGAILYKGKETDKGGENAVDFDKASLAGDGEIIAEVSIDDIPPGTYEWVRTSVTYQNYDIFFNLNNLPVLGQLSGQKGTLASFVGFNTYISELTPRQQTLPVNAAKKQGFWAFETSFEPPYDVYDSVYAGQAPNAATTVVNPLFESSPIPAGSCVVTGKFSPPLVITGNEKADIKVLLSFSINKSLEWEDNNGNGQLDFYGDDASKNEKIVDMGLRGLVPSWE